MLLIRKYNVNKLIIHIISIYWSIPKDNYPYRLYGLWVWFGVVKFSSDFIISMSKETCQEIKRISGEELKELLSNLDNVFDLGTGTLLDDSYLASTDH